MAATNNGSIAFCTAYCGYHLSTTYNGAPVYYAFVGNPSVQCPSKCSPTPNLSASPNKDTGVDAMLNVVAQQLVELVTDPVPWPESGRAWQDAAGLEAGDKCAWNFGATYPAVGGGRANLRLGTRDYLVQTVWDPVKQACGMVA